jgi:hypothetical protein
VSYQLVCGGEPIRQLLFQSGMGSSKICSLSLLPVVDKLVQYQYGSQILNPMFYFFVGGRASEFFSDSDDTCMVGMVLN